MTKKEKYMSWDVYFMSIAVISSFRSKDKKTQTGSCIVDINKKIVGVGYNGLPIGFNDNRSKFWCDEEDENICNSKHSYVIHAEQNAIFNKTIQSIGGATIYITLFPCRECTKSIIQTGIKKVIYLNKKENHIDENKVVKFMLKEVGINLINFNKLNLKDKDFIKKLNEINNFYD